MVFFSSSRPIFPHTCVTFYELPYDLSTMELNEYLYWSQNRFFGSCWCKKTPSRVKKKIFLLPISLKLQLKIKKIEHRVYPFTNCSDFTIMNRVTNKRVTHTIAKLRLYALFYQIQTKLPTRRHGTIQTPHGTALPVHGTQPTTLGTLRFQPTIQKIQT